MIRFRPDRTPVPARIGTWSTVVVYGLVPGFTLLLAMTAGYLKWQDSSIRDSDVARVQSLQAAKDSAIALLSFRPDTIENDVASARSHLTAQFQDTYTQVTREVLIPSTKEQHVTAAARVPAEASVSTSQNHAVVLVFIDQTVQVGSSPPTEAPSSVRVTLDKVGERWLISGWDPLS